MTYHLRARSLPLLLVASALFGCSNNDAAGAHDAQPGDEVETHDDALAPSDAHVPDDMQVPDASPPDLDADASATPDGGVSVWLASSTGFELTESGGFLPPPVDGSTCYGDQGTWRYTAASRSMTRTGCSTGLPAGATVVLSPASASELVARLSDLKAKGPKAGACGADAPDIVLTILGPGTPGNTQRSFDSDFYSGCQGFDAGGDLFVSFSDLEGLESDLSGYAAACRPVDGGGAPDAGASCVIDGGDGGPDGAPNDGSTGG